ncbi:hypothetical protein JQ600_34830 [Bradyrhizobium sp. AUGA SZCCT0176]|uniref:hypothetical protein n=1 Tax=unclassified Bradyrhizobium TaxID=2631580 RepID=UPI001BADB231|nr:MULTISPECIES: hypothetical protein [unclassified Bradyrhizobium]MBR1230071.1 hypothetical protein [Bradyrhizobium sp. AUGA SZCCT0176]MBR1281959.1 hypothetical protein [Bradyrhizobium sp. AUGA SZCCT0177]
MCTKSGHTSGRLRVTQAFIALSGIPESASVPSVISIVRIGIHEIRIFNVSSPVGDEPALWIELFDHDTKVSVDCCSFREIDAAIAAFDDMVSQAERLNEADEPEAGDAPV